MGCRDGERPRAQHPSLPPRRRVQTTPKPCRPAAPAPSDSLSPQEPGPSLEQSVCSPETEPTPVCLALFLSSSKVSASLSCTVVEATSGMVGILRCCHCQGRQGHVGGRVGEGLVTALCRVVDRTLVRPVKDLLGS